MNKNFKTIASLLTCAFGLSSALRAAEYAVTIQTAPLASSSLSGNGPFSLDFQFNYGGATFNNTAIINNFSFGGGSAAGAPTIFGSAAGSLSSAVTFSPGTSQFNELYQAFNPGSTVSFDVTVSDNPTGQTPDGVAVAILDNTGGQIVTTDPQEGLSLATVAIGPFGALTTAAYSGINNTDPSNLVDLGDYTGVTATITAVPVPEPSALVPMAGILAFGLLILKRKTVVRA